MKSTISSPCYGHLILMKMMLRQVRSRESTSGPLISSQKGWLPKIFQGSEKEWGYKRRMFINVCSGITISPPALHTGTRYVSMSAIGFLSMRPFVIRQFDSVNVPSTSIHQHFRSPLSPRYAPIWCKIPILRQFGPWILPLISPSQPSVVVSMELCSFGMFVKMSQ